MKKLLTILLLLTCITMVHAQTDYHIMVKGVKVTSANASDVLGDGTVKYNASGAILEFTNANIVYSSKVLEFEESCDRNVRVYFYGNNEFTSTATTSSVIGSYSPKDISLCGQNGGSLKIKGAAFGIYLSDNSAYLDILDLKLNIDNSVATGYGIYAGGLLRIQSSSVNISTGQYGIRHVPSAEKQLKIVNSNLTIKATGTDAYGINTNSNSKPYLQSSTIDITTPSTVKGAFYSYNEPELVDVHFDTGSFMTSYIKYDLSLRGYYDSSTTKALVKSLKILPGEYYDLKVNGKEVTSVNASSILGNSTIQYSSYTNTLTLNGANFSSSSNAIQLGKSVKINVVGTNTITSSVNGIYSTYPFEITGTGTLNITSTATSNYAPVNLYSSHNVLTVSGGVTVNLKGSLYGLRNGQLVVNKSVMNVHGNTTAFYNVSGLTLDDSQITELYYNNKAGMCGNNILADGTFKIKYDSSAKKFTDNGTTVSEAIQDVAIGYRRFGLKIKGKHVDVNNCNDVLGDGKVSYQETGNKLYMNNANISSSTYAILNETRKELNVYFSGNNTLANVDGAVIYAHYNQAPVHIYGENLNTYVLLKGVDYGVYASDPISISNIHCVVNTTAYNSKGIFASGGLNVSNARLDVNSNKENFTGILGYGKISNNSKVDIKASYSGARGIHVQWGNLEVDGSNVDISADDAAVYCTQGTNLVLNPNVRINEVSTNGDYYYEPSDISMNGNAISDGINVCLGLKIGPYTIKGVKVAGRSISSYNANDILYDGKAKFDPSTYTLYFDNANVVCSPDSLHNAIEITDPGKDVTIVTNGKCYFEGNIFGLYVQGAKVTIKGNSIEDEHNVQFFGANAGASIVNGSTLTLDNSYSVFHGEYWGLKALPTCTLNLVHSKCYCYGASKDNDAGSLLGFRQINYDGHRISPLNPAKIIDGTAYEVQDNGPVLRSSWIMIEPMASGDIDGNGQVEVNDVKTLHEKILFGDYDPSADINGDGKVTILDIVLLNKLLLQKNK